MQRKTSRRTFVKGLTAAGLLGGLGLWAEEKAIVLARCSTSAASVRMYVTQREPGRCTAGGKEQRAEIERRNEGKATTTGKCLRNFKVT